MSDEDPRFVLGCRLGLLMVSLLHWLAFAMFLSQKPTPVVQTHIFTNLC